MTMSITALKPTADEWHEFHTDMSDWYELLDIAREAAPDALSDHDWAWARRNDGFRIGAELATQLATAIEAMPRADVLMRHDEISNKTLRYFLGFLRNSGGFKIW